MPVNDILSTTHISNIICNTLKSHGVTIQRYSAKTSESEYLKFDYGVLKSLRISDHKSKSHLKYRYNIGTNVKQYRYDKSSKRFFFPMSDYGIDKLIQQVLNDRNDKLKRYGQETYDDYMTKNQQQNMDRRGFWRTAEIVE